MAIPPADFVLHNSLFLIAHFHNVIIGGVVFGAMAGITYWFPKAFGFTLNERLGKAVFWCWFIGFYLAFMPLYILGLMGATRRIQHYSNVHWQPLMIIAFGGALLILLGIVLTGVQLAVSIRHRAQHRDLTGDPWNGRTLEWSTPSPPPSWNFSHLPQVSRPDQFWATKQQRGSAANRNVELTYQIIQVPRNNSTGFFLAAFAVVLGFSLVWRIWWGASLGLLGLIVVALLQAWRTDGDTGVTAEEIATFEKLRAPNEGLA
jgi:cytochrome o ubiquinol oxidase subunit 1